MKAEDTETVNKSVKNSTQCICFSETWGFRIKLREREERAVSCNTLNEEDESFAAGVAGAEEAATGDREVHQRRAELI